MPKMQYLWRRCDHVCWRCCSHWMSGGVADVSRHDHRYQLPLSLRGVEWYGWDVPPSCPRPHRATVPHVPAWWAAPAPLDSAFWSYCGPIRGCLHSLRPLKMHWSWQWSVRTPQMGRGRGATGYPSWQRLEGCDPMRVSMAGQWMVGTLRERAVVCSGGSQILQVSVLLQAFDWLWLTASCHQSPAWRICEQVWTSVVRGRSKDDVASAGFPYPSRSVPIRYPGRPPPQTRRLRPPMQSAHGGPRSLPHAPAPLHREAMNGHDRLRL